MFYEYTGLGQIQMFILGNKHFDEATAASLAHYNDGNHVCMCTRDELVQDCYRGLGRLWPRLLRAPGPRRCRSRTTSVRYSFAKRAVLRHLYIALVFTSCAGRLRRLAQHFPTTCESRYHIEKPFRAPWGVSKSKVFWRPSLPMIIVAPIIYEALRLRSSVPHPKQSFKTMYKLNPINHPMS